MSLLTTTNVTSSRRSSSMTINLFDINNKNNMIDEQMSTNRGNHKITCGSMDEYKGPSATSSNNEMSLLPSSSLLSSSLASTMSVSSDSMAVVGNFNSQHFPTNLHDLLDEAEKENHSHMISWCSQGQAFKIHFDQQGQNALVVPSLLARYFTFRPTKFKSFLHQLQSYGFHRTSRANHQQGCGVGVVIVMSHPLFIRGKRSLCLRMSRKATAAGYSSSLSSQSLISLRAQILSAKSASSPNMNMNINMNSNSNFYAPKTTVSSNYNIKAKAFRKINSAPIFSARRKKAITDLSEMKNATFELKQEGEPQQQPMMMGVGMRSFTAAAASFQRPRRSSSATPPGAIRVLNPCTYMMKLLLQNSDGTNQRKTRPLRRIDSFSTEQALYFEPYQVSEIKIELLKALRASNLDRLRSLIDLKEEQHPTTTTTTKMFTMSEEEEEEVGHDSTHENLSAASSAAVSAEAAAASSSSSQQPLLQLQDLKARNQFGENLLHLACRMGISRDVLEFLVDGPAKVPLNVRDKFGRTPLHNSCLSTVPNFDNIRFVISKAPRTLLFEDDNGKVPFELIPLQCFEQWTTFLVSEEETGGKNILRQAAQAIPW